MPILKDPPTKVLDGTEMVFVYDETTGSALFSVKAPFKTTTQDIANLGGGGGGGVSRFILPLDPQADPASGYYAQKIDAIPANNTNSNWYEVDLSTTPIGAGKRGILHAILLMQVTVPATGLAALGYRVTPTGEITYLAEGFSLANVRTMYMDIPFFNSKFSLTRNGSPVGSIWGVNLKFFSWTERS